MPSPNEALEELRNGVTNNIQDYGALSASGVCMLLDRAFQLGRMEQHERDKDVVYKEVPKLFRGYRPNPPADYVEKGHANAEGVQYEGVVFSDGTVVVRWLTKYNSHSVWKDYETFYAVHGHPEYGTIIEWL